jgi:hypothetical protein
MLPSMYHLHLEGKKSAKQEDGNIHNYHCENLKSCLIDSFFMQARTEQDDLISLHSFVFSKQGKQTKNMQLCKLHVGRAV